jgi:4-methyl-5(b-hydroxyethyl)-thiazole monophosphate biosynthesis
MFDDVKNRAFDRLVIPGGTTAYLDVPAFMAFIDERAKAGQPIAAICAAPAVLGKLGLLRGKTATCYPGMENYLEGAKVTGDAVDVDGQFTTGRGPGLAIDFALTVLEQLEGKAVREQVAKDFLFKG